MQKKRKLGRKLLSFLLTLAMVIGLMPGMSLTAQADATKIITMEGDVLKIDNAEWNTEYINSFHRYYLPSGSYKLGSNIETNYRIAVKQGETVTLDIGEYNITRKKDEGDAIEVSGNLTINGTTGSIINNNLGSCILVGETGELTLNDGTITNNGGDNKSRCEGVNVCGKFTMNGGSLANNTKAIRLDDGAGTFIMNGGSITGNTEGIALNNPNASVILSGNVNIADNTKNVYIYSNATKMLEVGDSHLGSNSTVGVTTQTQPSESADVKVATGASKEDIQYIHSDNPGNAGTIFCDGEKDWVYYDGVAQLSSGVEHHSHEANTVWLGVAASDNNIENNVDNSCSVAFNANGHGTSMPANQIVEKGQKVTKPTDPTAEGFTFGGWYKEEGCTTAWNFESDTVTADTTLYAKWIEPAKVKTSPTPKEDLTYNGKQQELLTEGTSENGTMQYALGADSTTVPTSGWGTYIPKATNAGTYYGWYKVVGDENHTDTNPVCIIVDIDTKTDVSAEQKQGETLTYDGTTKTPTIDIKDGETEVSTYTVKYVGVEPTVYEESETAPTEAGNYKAVITLKGNYSGTKEVPFTVSPKSGTNFTAEQKQGETLTYDGTAKTPTIDIKDGETEVSTYTVKYVGVEPTVYEESETAPTEAGNYKAVITLKGNYSGTKEVPFMVSPKPETEITAEQKQGETLTYDGTAKTPTIDIKDGETEVSTYTVKYVGVEPTVYEESETAPTEAGNYKAVITLKGNYSGTKEVPFKINKIAAVVLTDDQKPTAKKNLIYKGEPQEIVNSPIELPDGYIGIQYAIGSEAGPTGEYTSSIPTATDAGTYYVWYKVVGDENHNDTEAVCVNVEIKKASQAAPSEAFTTSKATGSDISDGKIRGFAAAKAYQISADNGITWTDVKAGSTSLDVKAGTYQIRYAADGNHKAGASVSVTVGKKADQEKPTGLKVENVSAENVADGVVTGVTDAMEYSTDNGKTWKAVPANVDKIEGLATGEVLVRYTGNDDKNASPATAVTVGVASKTEGVVDFSPEESGSGEEEKAVTGVDDETTKASVDDFAETQQEDGRDVKVALEITPQKKENVNKESVEETNKVVEEVFAGIVSEKVVTEYLAIDVAKYVDNVKETENISDTKSPLEIALRFDSTKSNPVVIRTHDGEAKAFGKLKSRPAKKDYKDGMFYIDMENEILYIYSQYFSDFAIVYATETTYNVGFVSGTDASLPPLVVAEGGRITLSDDFLAKLKNDGCTFDGWYKDEAYTSIWNIDTDTVNSDITLYAKWNKSVSGVSVSPSEVKFTKAGETSQIKVTVTPEDAANTKVTYKSSDTKVATVDANGKITAVANGTSTITVTTEDGAKTATVKVTVAIPDVPKQGTSEQTTTEQPVQEPTKEEKAEISMNAGLKINQTGSKINIKWGKVKEADGYDVYVAYCGKKFGKAVRTVNKNNTTSVTVKKINGKKINLKKNYKVYVAAYKMTEGKKEILAKTITGHVVGRKNTKYSNAKKITLSKSKYSVKVGRTVKVKAKTVLVDKNKKQLSDGHAKEFRYATSNKNIATVDKNGKVKGIDKGTCTIYVYARNGYAKTVKVTVK